MEAVYFLYFLPPACMQVALGLVVWLLVVPLCTTLLMRVAFARSFGEVRHAGYEL